MKTAFAVFAFAIFALGLATGKPSSLFVYEEAGDTITFFSPRTVRIVHAATGDAGVHACQYDLPENGNMLSGGAASSPVAARA